jgi:hypothetical protein
MPESRKTLPARPRPISCADVLRRIRENQVGIIPAIPDNGCIEVDDTVSEEYLNNLRNTGGLTVDHDVTEKLLRSVMDHD